MSIQEALVTKKYSIAEARHNLPGVIHEAEGGTRVELTRRGKPVAVLLGIESYERLAEGRRDFWEAYEEFRRQFDLGELAIEPEEVFGGVRDPSPGREFSW
jgi:antitoxin Phd